MGCAAGVRKIGRRTRRGAQRRINGMKLYTFINSGRPAIGVGLKEQIIDLPAAYAAMRATRKLPPDSPEALPGAMLHFLRLGESGLSAAREVLSFMQNRPALPVGVQVAHLFET